MDKQLIERIALEVAKDYLKLKLGDRKGLDIYDLDLDDEDLKPLISEIERECADSFMQFLARIDAERGKEAVAYALMWRTEDGSEALQFPVASSVDEAKRDITMYGKADRDAMRIAPLFLSPTIPEGYVLVPLEPTKKMVEAIDAVMWPGASEKAYRGMIAAAQGERNAD